MISFAKNAILLVVALPLGAVFANDREAAYDAFARGVELWQAGHMQTAALECDKAIRAGGLQTDYMAQAYFARGTYRMNVGYDDAAIADFEEG